MKKFSFLAVGIVLFGGIYFAQPAQATTWIEYWQKFATRFSSIKKATTTQKTVLTSVKTAPLTSKTKTNSYRPSTTINDWAKKKTVDPTTRQAVTYQTKGSPILSVKVNSIRARQAIQIIDTTPIRIFTLGFSHKGTTNSQVFQEPILVRTATFSMVDNTGLMTNMSHFKLVVEDQEFWFDKNGSITIKFQNARLSKGDSLGIDVSLKVDDPEYVPHIPGALRIRLNNVTAVTESSGVDVPIALSGTQISDQIVFDPTASSTTPSVLTTTPRYIYGSMLSAGQKILAMSMNFEAHYDDMLIESLTVRDTIGGNSMDSYVKEARVIDLSSNKILETAKFTSGKAKFTFHNPVKVPRETMVSLGIEIVIQDQIRLSSVNAEFQLDMAPEDVVVQGIGSGKELTNSNKNFSINTAKFVVSNSSMSVASAADQPNGFAVIGSPQTVYRFVVSNPGGKSISFARISFYVSLSGMEFSGGGFTPDDAQLMRVSGSQEYGAGFSPIISANNKVTFDASDEYFIAPGETAEFALQIALDDLATGNSDYDSVSVQILSDGSYNVGTLASVRASGANFIWSDRSASVHSVGTSDWTTGYQVSGLPSNTVINKRSGK